MSDFVPSGNNYPLVNLEGTGDIILSSKELKQIEGFLAKIDISNSKFILEYANKIQDEISSSCSKLLVITQDIPSNPEDIKKVIGDISNLTTENEVGFFERRKVKIQYTAVSKSLTALMDIFTSQQLVLIGKSRELKKLEQSTAKYRKWLFMHIQAGHIRLKSIKAQEIPSLASDAQKTGNIMLAEKHSALLNSCDRFEKRLAALQNSMSLANLSLTQIRLVVKDIDERIEELSTILNTTIPNWKSQIKISIGIDDLKSAKEKQNDLMTETTYALAKKANKLQKEDATKVDLLDANISLLNIISKYDEVSERNNNEIFLMKKELERISGLGDVH